ncbi:restriction endonuclease subunit S [Pedobacter nanyangensis]|uniref:restriction endonuclease subunit S n=1 Tax=Pedobacter nanyangensis TaxID=1562389 RepID=UPI0013B45C07|nr:restriction endonuclease subunit S [Pedobacter nanyangensis]
MKKRNIPNSWKWVTIDDIGIIVSGGTPSTKEEEFWNGDIPWVTPADLSNYDSIYISKGQRNISKVGLEYSSAIKIPKNSIIFSSRAPIGYVAITSNDLATNQGFKNLVLPSEELINPKFVYYYLKTVKEIAENMASGTTFLELSATKFKQIPFPLPPIEDQNSIVEKIDEIFSQLDKSIEDINSAITKINLSKTSIAKKYFNDINDEKRYLGEIIEITSSKRIFKSEYLDSGIPFYRIREIVELSKNYSTEEKIFISEDRYKEIKEKFGVPKKNDILLTAIGTIGEVYIVNGDNPFYFKDGNILWLKLNEKIDSMFLKLCLQNEISQIKHFSGSTYEALNIERLKSIKIPFPSLDVQRNVSSIIEHNLSNLKKLEEDLEDQIRKTKLLYRKTLQYAFQGELCPQSKSNKQVILSLEKIKKEKDIYILQEKNRSKNRTKIQRMERENLSIMQVLEKQKTPISSKELWQDSMYRDDIEKFYSELKKIQHRIIEEKSERGSLISLK